MSKALAEVLADIDDPEMVADLLTEVDSNETSLSSSAGQSTLSDLYERYLERRQDRSPSTRAQYKRTLPHFISYCEQRDTAYPSELTTELIDEYVDELFNKHSADATILTYTKNIRAWLRWLNNRGLCEASVFRILDKEDLGLSPTARDEAISKGEATHALTLLRQQRRGSAKHALLELLWNGGPRIGEIHSLDVTDFDYKNKDLYFRHRPSEGTRLKNGDSDDKQPGDGERDINLHPKVADSLTLYIQTSRPTVTDEYGREPLFTTSRGRASRSTLRRWVYEATSCRWSHGGPTDIVCNGTCDPDSSVCPHSYYPHAIRRGAIVNHLSGGLRPDRAGERFNVSTTVIKKHYDPRTKQKKKNDRAKAVKNAWSEY